MNFNPYAAPSEVEEEASEARLADACARRVRAIWAGAGYFLGLVTGPVALLASQEALSYAMNAGVFEDPPLNQPWRDLVVSALLGAGCCGVWTATYLRRVWPTLSLARKPPYERLLHAAAGALSCVACFFAGTVAILLAGMFPPAGLWTIRPTWSLAAYLLFVLTGCLICHGIALLYVRYAWRLAKGD